MSEQRVAQGYDRFVAMGEQELLTWVEDRLKGALQSEMTNSEVAEFSQATRALGVKGYRFNPKTHRYEKKRVIR